ncbi:hypothetical protein Pelo_8085 [Pelomyxa schiedti]|nr:hypothetical protein Pelo_8085 [Pelomyxa schiedti]
MMLILYPDSVLCSTCGAKYLTISFVETAHRYAHNVKGFESFHPSAAEIELLSGVYIAVRLFRQGGGSFTLGSGTYVTEPLQGPQQSVAGSDDRLRSIRWIVDYLYWKFFTTLWHPGMLQSMKP